MGDHFDFERNSQTPLHIACKSQNLEQVKNLLESGVNADPIDDQNLTPLHLACTTKSDVTVEIIELLIKHKANIESVDLDGWTPLYRACIFNNEVAVKCLLKHNANANVRDRMGYTLFYWIFFSNHDDMTVCITELLLQNQGNIEALDSDGWTPLIRACYKGNYDLIKCLLDHNANVEAMDGRNWTPLMIACYDGNHRVVKSLLEYNANVEAKDTIGWTPLMIACNKNNYECTKHLLDHHANIEIVDDDGYTSFMIACDQGHLKIMQCLIDHHSNIEAANRRSWTSLRIACENGNHEVIQFLFNYNASIDAVDDKVWTPFMIVVNDHDYGYVKCLLAFEEFRKYKIYNYHAEDNNLLRTPLHLACKSQDLKLVESLLKQGENPNAIDNKGNTPLHLACISQSDVTVKIIELLLQYKANIEAVDECSWTPLFKACVFNNDVAVKCLLKNHADVNARDQMGYTPLHWIFVCNSDDIALNIAQLLVEYHANVEAKSNMGRTPLLMACFLCNDVAAKFFLDNHANPFVVGDKGFTSLHYVSNKKNDKTVILLELLLERFANTEAVDERGWTPLIVACNHGNLNAVKCLLAHHANVNHTSKNKLSCLHIAIELRAFAMAECLLKYGFDVNLMNEENETPLETAFRIWLTSRGFEKDLFEILTILQAHVIALKVAGFELSENNVNIIYKNNERTVDISKYEGYCRKEIRDMKRERIFDKITYYDFLSKNDQFLRQLITNKDILPKLNQEQLDDHFQFYINIIRNRYREATLKYTRDKLLNPALEYFRSSINSQIPIEIVDMIFSHFNISQLRLFLSSQILSNEQSKSHVTKLKLNPHENERNNIPNDMESIIKKPT